MTAPALAGSSLPLSEGNGEAGSLFDQMAAGYDALFTHSRIGTLMRQAVWSRLDERFRPGDHLLELNCGTGEDAISLAKRGLHVVATDASRGMIEVARQKALRAVVAERITFRQMPIEEVSDVQCPTPLFDGALSNFGGLNCVADMRGVAEGLAACLRPGAFALLCIMGPLCPWEWGWYLRKGQPGKAFRRLKPGGVPWHGLTIRYPSIRTVRRAFAPEFRLRRVSAIGALLPPTYAEAWAGRHERLLATLNGWERRWETLPPLPALADHYLLELERV